MSREIQRKLTTIFSADVSGYSRLMDEDEVATLATLKEFREVIAGFIARHHGRVVSWSGDGLLADFASCVEAVTCAIEIQKELKGRNGALPLPRQMHFRIGINLGDVMVEGHDIFGEGVNIASRLQALAEPGGILISGSVFDQVRNKLQIGFDFLGERPVKNISDDVPVYKVDLDGSADARAAQPVRRLHGAKEDVAYSGLVRRLMAFIVDFTAASFIAFVLAVVIEQVFDDAILITMPLIDLSTERIVEEPVTEVQRVETGYKIIETKIIERTILGLTRYTFRVTNEKLHQPNVKNSELSSSQLLNDLNNDHDTTESPLDFGSDFKVHNVSDTREHINPSTKEPIDPPSMLWLTLLVYVAYLSWFEGRPAGAALGKQALGLKVRDEDGAPITLSRSFGRNISKIASIGTLGLGFLLPFFMRRRQTLHDRLADCVVIIARPSRVSRPLARPETADPQGPDRDAGHRAPEPHSGAGAAPPT